MHLLIVVLSAWFFICGCSKNHKELAHKNDTIERSHSLIVSQNWLNESDCEKIKYDILDCPNRSENFSIGTMYCITSSSTDTIEVGKCTFGACAESYCYHNTIPNNQSIAKKFMCTHFSRSGTLCGQCQDGYYPLVYSFDMKCVKCPHGKSNWWKYLLVAFLPITVFYMIVIFFKINITTSPLHGAVLYCQIISMPGMLRILVTIPQDKIPIMSMLQKCFVSFSSV